MPLWAQIEAHPHPLALYLFSENQAIQRKVLDRCHFGGGCLNDTIIHLATSAMPFGGVGESGMGGYHGKAGFEAFSHLRSIVDKKTWIDMPVRYQPLHQSKGQNAAFLPAVTLFFRRTALCRYGVFAAGTKQVQLAPESLTLPVSRAKLFCGNTGVFRPARQAGGWKVL